MKLFKTKPITRKLKIKSDKDFNVELNIGDTVIDVYSDEGTFHIEEINQDGWIWSSEMKNPYYDGNKKNFMDYHITWKV